MRQHLSPEQTAKLIELGFEKPKGWCVEGISSRLIMYKSKEDNEGFNYSIGELIEMLPKVYDSEGLSMGWHYMADVWIVRYPKQILIHKEEFIDALYAMIVKLKEEGVI